MIEPNKNETQIQKALTDPTFEQRKKDHITCSLNPDSQWEYHQELEKVRLIHEALPEMNFDEVTINTNHLGMDLSSPIFVSSMTAGHVDGEKINEVLTEACASKNWLMGVGSQRKELSDPSASLEWQRLKKKYPQIKWVANLGLSQLIHTKTDHVQMLLENLEAVAIFIHLNPLQECLQPEGTPQFRGGLEAINQLCKKIDKPVIIKEVGCGISVDTALKLKDSGIKALDVSGLGGTHWGRIENLRTSTNDEMYPVGKTFKDWGLETFESLYEIKKLNLPYSVWASGGVRSGLDAAKYLALGAEMVGVAQPFLKAAMMGNAEPVIRLMNQYEKELKIAMFCCGVKSINDFKSRKVWVWKNK